MDTYDTTDIPPVFSISSTAKLKFFPLKLHLPHQIRHEKDQLNNVPFLPMNNIEGVTLSSETSQTFLNIYHQLTTGEGKQLKNYTLSSDRTRLISQESESHPVLAFIQLRDWINAIVYETRRLKCEGAEEVNNIFKVMTEWRWEHQACVIMVVLVQ
ncbi:hypothetical protein PVK62_08265 [Aliivibrio sp. S3MY1]|uniref:hypothetical protein n=1 Tax=unclassified Aliivibrio TaxID=2645654 RepID=UPI002378E2EE|nr:MULTISPECIES: hypothetical protein [unclassified Aliivibrio]MDD9175955.1 hypothetical protein [Aliivibrio sp. S3TY1]MDD9193130.1 hypothetical protein [Aliivibrio sp. S2TY2]MDD9195834.1 hypothetical protein [Aliivibrio sp. S3MY1]